MEPNKLFLSLFYQQILLFILDYSVSELVTEQNFALQLRHYFDFSWFCACWFWFFGSKLRLLYNFSWCLCLQFYCRKITLSVNKITLFIISTSKINLFITVIDFLTSHNSPQCGDEFICISFIFKLSHFPPLNHNTPVKSKATRLNLQSSLRFSDYLN